MDRALLAGWAKLVGTNGASGVLLLLGFAIAAQSLDVAALGIIVLIQAYVRVVDGVFNFQSVNVLTRFLAEADHRGDAGQFRGLVKAGLLVDGLTAVLACVVAVSALPFVGGHVGIPEAWTTSAMLFALVILTRITGVTEAVLRCFDHFWAIGLRGTITGLLLVAGSLAAWWSGAGAGAFLAVWMLSEVAANLGFILWTYVVLRQQGVTGIWNAPALETIRQATGFWPMLWQTNITFGIRMLSQDADLLVAGAVLGPTAAGLLRAAKNVAGMVAQFGRPLQQVASAPIARLSARGDYAGILRYVGKISISAASVGFLGTILLFAYGEIVLFVLFGEEYISATLIMVLLVLARSIYLSSVTHLPTMLTLDLSKQFLYSVVIGTVVFFCVMSVTVSPLGLVGIACAHIAFDAVWSIAGWRWVLQRIAQLQEHQSSPAI